MLLKSCVKLSNLVFFGVCSSAYVCHAIAQEQSTKNPPGYSSNHLCDLQIELAHNSRLHSCIQEVSNDSIILFVPNEFPSDMDVAGVYQTVALDDISSLSLYRKASSIPML